MIQSTRHQNRFWKYLDTSSYHLLRPWLKSLNLVLAAFVPWTGDERSLIESILYGTLYAAISISLAPVGVVGIILWVITCILSTCRDFTYAKLLSDEHLETSSVFSIMTCNVCLLPECLARFNNLPSTSKRCAEITRRIRNYATGDSKESDGQELQTFFGITADLSPLDFLCLQEVWERATAMELVEALKSEFHYFLYDVGTFKCNTNLFCLGSGLFFASKYPILMADFKAYKLKTLHGRFTSLGLLQTKVQVGANRVGYIATTHLQSYQGKKPCLLSQLDEAEKWLDEFKVSTSEKDEQVVFDIFGGDFNFDNMSPGDRNISNHTIFQSYTDPCRIKPGVDTEWSIGTEMRQRTLWENEISTPEKFRKCLEDPVLRRRYVLDADVEIHTMELAFLKPPCDENGSITESPFGGRRRVDYILYNKSFPVEVIRYTFSSVFNQLTDHIPVLMKFRSSHETSPNNP